MAFATSATNMEPGDTNGEMDIFVRAVPSGPDLPPVFVPVLKLELNPILSCFVTTEVVES